MPTALPSPVSQTSCETQFLTIPSWTVFEKTASPLNKKNTGKRIGLRFVEMKNIGMSIAGNIVSERIISLYYNYSPGTAGCMLHEDLKRYYHVRCGKQV